MPVQRQQATTSGTCTYRTTDQTGCDADSSYDISQTNYIVIDLPVDFNELLAVEIAREGSYRGDDPIDLQDNVAIAIFDVLERFSLEFRTRLACG